MTYCYLDDAGYEVCEDDAWDSWERWLVLGLVVGVVVLAIVVFLIVSCVTARKRHSRGQQPYRGTAWTLGVTPPGHSPPTYTAKDVELGDAPPPPMYTPPNEREEQSYEPPRSGEESYPGALNTFPQRPDAARP